MKAILGEKLGMTQIFDDGSNAIPVTIIKAGPVHVTQIKRTDTDGYGAIQIAYKEMPERRVTRAAAGHFARAGVAPARHLVEVRVDNPDDYQLGQEIKVGDLFSEGGKADVAGLSKGKGFTGTMRRHNFKGQGASHGAHKVHRAPGSIGAASTPSRGLPRQADARSHGWRSHHGAQPGRRQARRRAGHPHASGRSPRSQGRGGRRQRGGESRWLMS